MNRWRVLAENVGLAVGIAVASVLVEFDVNKVTAWDTWALGILSLAIRAAAVTLVTTWNTWRRR